jgi:hypothetical protein
LRARLVGRWPRTFPDVEYEVLAIAVDEVGVDAWISLYGDSVEKLPLYDLEIVDGHVPGEWELFIDSPRSFRLTLPEFADPWFLDDLDEGRGDASEAMLTAFGRLGIKPTD